MIFWRILRVIVPWRLPVRERKQWRWTNEPLNCSSTISSTVHNYEFWSLNVGAFLLRVAEWGRRKLPSVKPPLDLITVSCFCGCRALQSGADFINDLRFPRSAQTPGPPAPGPHMEARAQPLTLGEQEENSGPPPAPEGTPTVKDRKPSHAQTYTQI